LRAKSFPKEDGRKEERNQEIMMVDVVFILRRRVLSFPEGDGREYRNRE
jgi:hypothetical protein